MDLLCEILTDREHFKKSADFPEDFFGDFNSLGLMKTL
jgi:hypothetical protein